MLDKKQNEIILQIKIPANSLSPGSLQKICDNITEYIFNEFKEIFVDEFLSEDEIDEYQDSIQFGYDDENSYSNKLPEIWTWMEEFPFPLQELLTISEFAFEVLDDRHDEDDDMPESELLDLLQADPNNYLRKLAWKIAETYYDRIYPETGPEFRKKWREKYKDLISE